MNFLKSILFVAINLLVVDCATLYAAEPEEKIVQADVNEMVQNTYNGNVDVVLEHTHPKVIEGLGGAVNAKTVIADAMSKFSGIGLKLEEFSFPSKPTFIKSLKNEFVLIPTFSVITANGQTVESQNYQFGVRTLGEKTWKYIEGSRMNNETVKTWFPDFPDNIKFPLVSRKKR